MAIIHVSSPAPIADARDDPLQVASCRSAHLSKQPSKALSSRQWMQAIPKKGFDPAKRASHTQDRRASAYGPNGLC